MRLRIGDQILAELCVDVVGTFAAGPGIKADGHAVGQLIGEVGMHQHSHGRRQMIDAMELALCERPEGPQTREHLLERLVDAVLIGLLGMLCVGVV